MFDLYSMNIKFIDIQAFIWFPPSPHPFQILACFDDVYSSFFFSFLVISAHGSFASGFSISLDYPLSGLFVQFGQDFILAGFFVVYGTGFAVLFFQSDKSLFIYEFYVHRMKIKHQLQALKSGIFQVNLKRLPWNYVARVQI